MVRGSMAVAAAQVLLGLPGAPDGFITFNPRMLSRLLNAPSSDNCTCDLTESLQEFSHKLMKGDRNSKDGARDMIDALSSGVRMSDVCTSRSDVL